VQTSHASHSRCAADPRAFQRRLPADLRGTPGGPKPVETPSCRSAFDDAHRASVTALAFPLPSADRGSSGLVTAAPLSVRVLSSGDSASSRAPFSFRPSPIHTRLGASSAFPKRFGTIASDTLVTQAALFGASRAKDALHLPRVNAAGFLHPGCLTSTKCDRGALNAVSRGHSFHSRFRDYESSTTRHLRAALPPRSGFRALLSARSRPAFAFRAGRRCHR
jgi:hypothetical protein